MHHSHLALTLDFGNIKITSVRNWVVNEGMVKSIKFTFRVYRSGVSTYRRVSIRLSVYPSTHSKS